MPIREIDGVEYEIIDATQIMNAFIRNNFAGPIDLSKPVENKFIRGEVSLKAKDRFSKNLHLINCIFEAHFKIVDTTITENLMFDRCQFSGGYYNRKIRV